MFYPVHYDGSVTGPEGQMIRYRLHVAPVSDGGPAPGYQVSGLIAGVGAGATPVQIAQQRITGTWLERQSGPSKCSLEALLVDWIERGAL
ncbi:hypothetical protein ACFJGW_16875 [Burkholderiaceae bacterium UC74_6]